jgi:hypothetical protein
MNFFSSRLGKCSVHLSNWQQAGAIVELRPGEFGCEPISSDDARAFRRSIAEGRRPPLKRVQTALCSFVKYYGCAWARCVICHCWWNKVPVAQLEGLRSCSAAQWASCT